MQNGIMDSVWTCRSKMIKRSSVTPVKTYSQSLVVELHLLSVKKLRDIWGIYLD